MVENGYTSTAFPNNGTTIHRQVPGMLGRLPGSLVSTNLDLFGGTVELYLFKLPTHQKNQGQHGRLGYDWSLTSGSVNHGGIVVELVFACAPTHLASTNLKR